jgi:hypothetical protein
MKLRLSIAIPKKQRIAAQFSVDNTAVTVDSIDHSGSLVNDSLSGVCTLWFELGYF